MMWLKLSQRDFVGITFCRQRFIATDYYLVCA